MSGNSRWAGKMAYIERRNPRSGRTGILHQPAKPLYLVLGLMLGLFRRCRGDRAAARAASEADKVPRESDAWCDSERSAPTHDRERKRRVNALAIRITIAVAIKSINA
jgi:hypothetical protein